MYNFSDMAYSSIAERPYEEIVEIADIPLKLLKHLEILDNKVDTCMYPVRVG